MEKGDEIVLSSTLYLDRVGEVIVTLHPDGLSWSSLDLDTSTSCFGMRLNPKIENKIKFEDIYAIEHIKPGFIYDPSNPRAFLRGNYIEMHRFVVHGIIRPKRQPSPWILCEYTFGDKESNTCQAWTERLNYYLNSQYNRPMNLLVFVHPLCGKGKGCKTWDMVAPIFSRAKVQAKVTVTQRAGHAYESIASLPDRELKSFDGIVTVGGDGLFNEILNGLLHSRHKSSYPPAPTRELNCEGNICRKPQKDNVIDKRNDMQESAFKSDDDEPLLSSPISNGIPVSNGFENGSNDADEVPSVSFPNDWLRLGIIPAGSTDAIVLSTTGVRDPVTSALHIILGSKISLDIAQFVRWKVSPSLPLDSPTLQYAASFGGYGFYGDVIQESEKYRWMGPVRYDYAGTMVFLKHRSYEAEVTYLETKDKNPSQNPRKRSHKQICRANCFVCNRSAPSDHELTDSDHNNPEWSKSKGRFLSVGAAVMSCRNERAPDGLVSDAHLNDGFLHLILVRECPRPYYLWHLTQLTKRGSDPLSYSFVEHHKTTAFTFESPHNRSVWNLDGEMFQASQVSVQVCRGLVNLFASGPQV